jgi:site-specific DNA-methyltransferase (adenine-specific)
MKTNKLYNGDCLSVLPNITDNFIDGVITSPPYNMGHNPLHFKQDKSNRHKLYETFIDDMSNTQYINFTLNVFKQYDRIIKEKGVVLYNLSYSSKNAILPMLVINEIHNNTNFTLRDTIVWKKNTAFPFQTSPHNLSRICEFVYVFGRKDITYTTNKPVTKINERTQQKFYGYMDNFIEAKNNDRVKLDNNIKHNATYSVELVMKLIDMYFPEGSIILDNFSGIGTTAVGCINTDRDYIGIEIDKNYHDFAVERVNELDKDNNNNFF